MNSTNRSKRISQKLAALFIMLLMSQAAFAITLQEAKDQGLVGERSDGYLGLVVTDVAAEVTAMVREVNNQRRDEYQRIARQNDIDLSQVSALAYERAVANTKPGHFVQNLSGRWVKK